MCMLVRKLIYLHVTMGVWEIPQNPKIFLKKSNEMEASPEVRFLKFIVYFWAGLPKIKETRSATINIFRNFLFAF